MEETGKREFLGVVILKRLNSEAVSANRFDAL
jgi:hypothetical protein